MQIRAQLCTRGKDRVLVNFSAHADRIETVHSKVLFRDVFHTTPHISKAHERKRVSTMEGLKEISNGSAKEIVTSFLERSSANVSVYSSIEAGEVAQFLKKSTRLTKGLKDGRGEWRPSALPRKTRATTALWSGRNSA